MATNTNGRRAGPLGAHRGGHWAGFSRASARQFLVDELHRIADRLDVLGGIIRDLDVEFFLEGHDQFDVVERVGAQVVDEAGLFGDLVGISVQVVDDDLADAFQSVGPGCLCLDKPLNAAVVLHACRMTAKSPTQA